MVKALEVCGALETIAPLSTGNPEDELGFLYGEPERPIQGVTTCWAPTLALLERSAAEGRDLLICHEPLFFPLCQGDLEGSGASWIEEKPVEEKIINCRRRQVLERSGMVVYRAHSNWDNAPGLGIVDQFAALMGFRREIYRGRYARIYEIEPVSLAELALQAKRKLNLSHIRVLGAPARLVSRPGVLIGGLGQLFTSPEEIAEHGADVGLFGEMLDYTFRCALELGLCAIETSHRAMENPGMRAMAEWLKERFPGLPVEFMDSGEIVWFT